MQAFDNYMWDFSKIKSFVRNRKGERIGLQVPEGLLFHSEDIAARLEEECGTEFFLFGEPTYGPCDIPSNLRDLKIDSLLHLGHAPLHSVKPDVPTLFVELRTRINVLDGFETVLKNIQSSVGLVTTIQHIHQINGVKKFLEKRGFHVFIGKGDGRLCYKGQVLGCNFSSATNIEGKVKGFLFFGSGVFHPLGLSFITKKPVTVYDPYSKDIISSTALKEFKEKILKQRGGAIAKGKESEKIGVIVCTKIGQRRLELAKKLKRLLESQKKKTTLIFVNNLIPDHLDNLGLDAYVCTACPRIAIDDYLRFKKPVLTPVEVDIMSGKLPWEKYRFDQILEVP